MSVRLQVRSSAMPSASRARMWRVGRRRPATPRGRIRLPRVARRAGRRAGPRCRRASTTASTRRGVRALARAHVVELTRGAASGAADSRSGVGHRRLAVRGDGVEAAARPVLVGGNLRVFPRARHQPHLLEPAERAVERAVGGEQLRVGRVLELLGDEVAVELLDAALAEGQRPPCRWRARGAPASRISCARALICRYLLIKSSRDFAGDNVRPVPRPPGSPTAAVASSRTSPASAAAAPATTSP